MICYDYYSKGPFIPRKTSKQAWHASMRQRMLTMSMLLLLPMIMMIYQTFLF
jgi:hypothetical protein